MTREEGKTLPEARGEVGRADQHPAVHRRRRRQARRPARAVRARSRLHPDPAASARRHRADHAVELPDRHSRVEDLSRADRRQRRRAEAVGPRAALRAAARRSAGRSRRDERRAQPCHGPRLEGRRRDRREPRRAGDLVHGIGRHRQRDCRRGGEAARPRAARNGRQEPDDRPGRRRHPRRRQRRRERRVLLDGAALHRDLSRHRRGGDSRAVHRGAGRADACAQGRQRPRGGHRNRPVDRRQAAGHGARLRRHRRGRGREACSYGGTRLTDGAVLARLLLVAGRPGRRRARDARGAGGDLRACACGDAGAIAGSRRSSSPTASGSGCRPRSAPDR